MGDHPLPTMMMIIMDHPLPTMMMMMMMGYQPLPVMMMIMDHHLPVMMMIMDHPLPTMMMMMMDHPLPTMMLTMMMGYQPLPVMMMIMDHQGKTQGRMGRRNATGLSTNKIPNRKCTPGAGRTFTNSTSHAHYCISYQRRNNESHPKKRKNKLLRRSIYTYIYYVLIKEGS